MATFQSIWAGFKASEDYHQIRSEHESFDDEYGWPGFNWDNVCEIVGNRLDTLLSEYIGKPRADWTTASITDYLNHLIDDDEIDSTQSLAQGPIVIGAPYCIYLAKTKQINAKPEDLFKIMAAFINVHRDYGFLSNFVSALVSAPVNNEGFNDDELDADDDYVPDGEDSSTFDHEFKADPSYKINWNPDLPIWQPNRLAKTNLDYLRLMKIYQERPEWENRPKAVTAKFMQDVIKSLLVIGYNHYRKLPRSWTKNMLVEIMTGSFVADRLYSQEEYAVMGSLLTDFIGFVGSQRVLSQNTVTQLQQYIQVAAAKMVEAAKNPDNYSADKKLRVDMQAAGVDLDSGDSIQKYLFDHQEEITRENDSGFPITAALFDNPEQLAQSIDHYDPDQERHYLDPDAHVETFEGRSWNREDAIKAHRLAVELAFRAYLDQQKENPENAAPVSDYVELFAFYVSSAYDFKLLQPDELTTDALEETMSVEYAPSPFIDDAAQQKALQRMKYNDIDQLLPMVDTIEAYTTLPEQRAHALRQVIRDEKQRLRGKLGMDATPAFRKKKKRKRPKKNRRNKR
ncbi:hypothetical protein Q7Q91_08925 [Lactiplantibacillus pentosus]|uniref:hypothetical protein n=1 Tax=Lactiplantibacillus pentosus TaxID=1589 RepID=UPI00270671B7|nr:hypothetical protein [Lactiplantibacillus pentosus]MDO7805101.1 hypothetical protein [Lactiplantibacillus pentosus]